MQKPICSCCHSDKYIVKLSISCDWSYADIRYVDNGWHPVHLFTCGKCGNVLVDTETQKMLRDSIDKKI